VVSDKNKKRNTGRVQPDESVDDRTFWDHVKKTANNNPDFCRMCDKWSLNSLPLKAIKADIRSVLSRHFGCDDSPERLQKEFFRAYEEKRIDRDLLARVPPLVFDRLTHWERYDFPDSAEWSAIRISVLSAAMLWADLPE
jgi:hypothetical protein